MSSRDVFSGKFDYGEGKILIQRILQMDSHSLVGSLISRQMLSIAISPSWEEWLGNSPQPAASSWWTWELGVPDKNDTPGFHMILRLIMWFTASSHYPQPSNVTTILMTNWSHEQQSHHMIQNLITRPTFSSHGPRSLHMTLNLITWSTILSYEAKSRDMFHNYSTALTLLCISDSRFDLGLVHQNMFLLHRDVLVLHLQSS